MSDIVEHHCEKAPKTPHIEFRYSYGDRAWMMYIEDYSESDSGDSQIKLSVDLEFPVKGCPFCLKAFPVVK